ncbi:UDP-GalNAc:beta-1,3-N-acetylgalactosaminyltransferase 1 isoform X3 [Cebus imitator]|uniref:UDP-GalNAc:beta-1, 3-N-acetylgalactosaminyltransferase 1 isoform X3 n=1 Tax=Cebus imitator TaxID=2715852 RepID=UPI001899B3A2|nr:UDP-GalNAc:beta-1,3-N-acetylgalactosaminyltransferase 1 isoform X3 [Cebus imitator]XP_037597590.1 UDP-GalNAc:beta-1,3-N-acetylgalactosaminyltransferase 1 isoform X3 [Cebus imitator]
MCFFLFSEFTADLSVLIKTWNTENNRKLKALISSGISQQYFSQLHPPECSIGETEGLLTQKKKIKKKNLWLAASELL